MEPKMEPKTKTIMKRKMELKSEEINMGVWMEPRMNPNT